MPLSMVNTLCTLVLIGSFWTAAAQLEVNRSTVAEIDGIVTSAEKNGTIKLSAAGTGADISSKTVAAIAAATSESDRAVSRSPKFAIGSRTNKIKNGTLPENATASSPKTFGDAEKEITDYINSFLRSLLPQIVGSSGGANLSPKCTAAMMKVFGNVRKLKGWTLKLLDSMGKPTSGILKGKSYSMGQYDQCLDISVTSRGQEATDPSEEMFRGQYCKVRVSFPEVVIQTAKDYHLGLVNASELGKLKEFIQATPYIPATSQYMTHLFGACLPSLCTLQDVQLMTKVITFPGSANVERCESKTETQLDTTQSVVIGIFICLLCLMCLGTVADWLLPHKKQKTETGCDSNKCLSIFVSFSVCNNTEKLMSKIQEDDKTPVKCVRGIFAASVVWIIIGHTYLLPYEVFYEQASSLDNLRQYLTEKTFSIVVSYPLAIDALFMCYGFLLTYRLWHASSKKQKVNVNVVRIICQRYIRLVCPLAFCFGVLFLLPVLGSGPFWADTFDKTINTCRKNVWAYIGMYGNFLNLDDQCLPHLWFVPCLMQITVISAIISWILAKNMKLGVFLLLLLTLMANAAVGVVTINNKLPPAYMRYFFAKDSSYFWKINYSLPLSHFGSFSVGMILGIATARRIHCHIRPVLALICWILSIAGICGLILSPYHQQHTSPSPTWSAVYAGNHRTVFSLCVAWILMACAFGKGGFVGAILSWKVLDPVFRLSYFAYLIHLLFILFIAGLAREQFHYCHTQLILKALAYVCVSYILSYVCFLMLEQPLRSLEARLCHSRCKEMSVNSTSESTSPKSIQMTITESKNSCQLWSVTESKNGDYRIES